MAGGVAGEVFVEAGRTARAVGRTLRRRLPTLLTGLAVLATFLSVVGFLGAVADDVAISRNRATATAEVLDGSTFARTLVRFPVPGGQLLVPERGVYHPRGLQPGTSVLVEYDRADPDLVRVAGRTAFSGLPPTMGFVALAWAVFGGAAVFVRRRRQAAHHE
ncbi:DUF3592 domain-containing protein [Pseudonocardia kujensis]|uniref:DUF3592 domain-containing protein n=1 Tax=Pseudonocardia kujensis TaxID=1128675 RepID=UPI001E633192|nr:DUF3592 domain-containing protein [Pseudonocardia kujensis]MCE0762667.1 DUF3592 domain-containing protein [Pseudonocardia kujensis]